MLSQDKINQLYQWLKEDGADVGTESEFSKWFTADGERGYNNRKQVWQAFKLDGADVGDTYEEFMSLIKSEKPASQPQPIASQPASQPPVETSVADSEPQVTATEAETLQAQPQAAQTATPLSDDARKRMAMQMEVMKQNQAAYTANTGKIVDDAKRMMQQNPMTEQGRQQAKVGEMQRQLLGEQKPIGLGSGSNSGNKSQQSGQQQANAINTISPTAYGITKKDGKWTTQYMLPTGELTDDLLQVDAAETAARHGRLTQEFLRRMKDNGLDPAKKEDVQKQANMDYFAPLAEAVNGAYDVIKAADDEQDKQFRENIHNSLTYFDDDSFTSELTMRAARQKANFNINAITDKAMSAIPESFRKQYTDNLARYYAQNPDECFGLSPNQAAEESLRKVVHDYAVERRLEALKPKDNAEFFFRKLVEQPLLSPAVFVDAVSSKMVGNKEDSNLNQQAMQQYESQHKAVGLGATVLGMMMDPAMYIGMPVGALAARGTLNLMGRFMLKGASRPIATRYAGMTLAGRLAAGAAGGAGNFATFEGLHEAQRQALYDNNFSAGAILGQTLHGAIMGGSVGWVGPMLGNTVSKINKTIGSTAGKAAVKGTANWAVAPVLEGTIFATPELLSDDNSDKMSIWADNVAMMYGFKLGHALKGIGTGIKEVGDKVSEDYRRYKDTQEYIPDFNREYIVNNWQRNAPSTETVFEEFKKFIHTGKTSLKEHIRNRIRAEENTGINDDERRWLDEHGYEEIKDLFVLKDNKKVVDGNIVTEKPAEDGSDLTALQEFVKDNTIPEALRAKMYYIATGKILPASTIAGYRLDCNNRDGKETYSVTALNSDGNPILTKYYKSKDLAEAYGKDIQRQVELNQIAIAEQKADEKAYKAGVNKTVNDIATRHGVSAEDVVNSINAITSSYGDKAADVVSGLYDVPKEDLLERIGEYISRRHGLTEYEKNILLDFINEVKNNNPGVLVGRDIAMLNEFQAGIQGSVYRQNAGSIRAELSREWGMDVDDAIRKRYDERNKDEHELVQEYLNRLNGAKRKPFHYGEKTNEPDPIGNNGNGAPEITLYGGNIRRAPRGDNNKQPLINDDKHIVEDNKPITEEDKSVIKEEQPIVEQVDPIDPIELEVEAARKKVNDIAHTETGDIQPVTIVDGIDEHPHEAFILQNTVVPDASGNVDRTKSDEMVVVYDNNEGKKKIISTAIIDKVQPTSTVDDTMALEEQIIKQSYQQPQPQQPQPQQPQQPQPQQPIVNNGEQPIQPAIPQAENSAVQPIQQTQEPPVAVNPMQPIEQPVVDSTIQPTIQPAEQPIEQPTEQQPESALARVPVDVDGTPVFTDTEPETAYDAIAEMMDGNEEDRDDIIKQSISNISKQIDTAKKKVSGVKLQGNNYGKFKAEKAAARQQLESLQQQLEKWNAIAGIGQQRAEAAAAEAKAAEEAAKAEAKRLEEERKAAAEAERLRDASRMKIREIEAQLGEPIDMFDYVMRAIGSGAYKFKWGDSNRTTHNTRGLGAHIGLKNSQDERRKRISFLDNKYGYYPEDAALRMLEDYTGNDRDRYTDQDVLNIILDVLQQYDTPRAIMEAAFKRHEAGVDMESAQDAYYEEQYKAEQDRYIAMYEQEAKELSQAATESEINGIFADVLILRGEYDYGQTGGTEVYGVQNPIPQGQELDGGMPQGTELLPRQESNQRETGEESPAGGSRVDAENVNNGTGNDAARPDADGGRTVGERIASAEADVDTEPTDKQKEAGNYKKGHVKIGSFDVTIENPKGSVRSGVDSNGERWSNTMNNTYGYIRGAIGVDGDHIDVYLSNDIDNWNGEKVYVIDVYNPDGSFDEHKVMLGFNEVTTAKEDFLKNYDASWGNNRRLDVSEVALADFEKWVNSSKRKTKPFAEYKSVRRTDILILSDEEAESLLSIMKANAVTAPLVEINGDNWNETFDTPIGVVKMGENQKAKLLDKGRADQYGMLMETLSNPDIILEENDREPNLLHERASSYLFVKTFRKEDGSKYIHYESVTVSQDGMEVSISSHMIRENQLRNKMKSDRLLYKATALDEPANSSAEQPVKRGGSLSSESKDSEKGGEKQEDKEGKHEFNIEQTTYTNKLNKTINVIRVTFNRELTDAERTAMNRIVKQPVVEGKRKTKGWFDFNTGGYMVRNLEYAYELVRVLTDKSGATVKDNQPISNSDVKELLGGEHEKKSPVNKVNVETLMGSLEKNGVATMSEHSQPVEEKSQYECSDEEMNALIKEMRDILGSDEDEADGGIHFRDGDTLTKAEKDKLLLVAARLTSALFERGNTDFDKYCAQMVKVIGSRVRPWLKSFYSFARYSPDNAKYNLSPDDFVNSFDVVGFDNPNTSIFTQADAAVEGKKAEKATIESEKSIIEKRNKLRNEREKQSRVSAAATAEKADAVSREAEAVAKAPTADTKQITDTIGKIDAALDEIDESLALIGYYDSPNAESKAAHDAAIIASRLYRDLGINTGSLQNDFQLSSARFWGEGGVINIRLPFSPDEIGEVCVDMKMQDNRYLPQNINVRRNYPKGYVIGRNTHVLLGGSTYGELFDNIRDLFKDVLPQAKNSVPVEEISVEQQPKSQPGKSKKSSNKPVAGNSQELGGLFSVPANVENNTPKVKKPVLRETSELTGNSAEFQQREMQTSQFVEEIGAVISSRVEMLRLDPESVKPLTMNDVKKLAAKYPLLNGIGDTDLQELVELAMTYLTREAAYGGVNGNSEQQRAAYDRIVSMYKIQPSLNARDSERLMKQQYSTPTPFGYVMGQFVRALGKRIDSVLEPSAGNGALTIALDPETVHANDIDEARLANLRKLGFRTVTAQNGLLPFKGEEVDVVMTNPPFGSVQEKEYEGIFRISSLEGQMAINALDSMNDDGRAAIIIGGNTNYRENGSMNPKDAAFFGYLYSRYNVVDVINISGKALYSRNGTGYDVRMILINGRKGGKFERVYPPVKSKARAEQVTTFDGLYKRVQDDIQQIQQVGYKAVDVQREPERPIDRGQSERDGKTTDRAVVGTGGGGKELGGTPVSDFEQPVRRNAGGRAGGLDNGNRGYAAGTDDVQRGARRQPGQGESDKRMGNERGGDGGNDPVELSPGPGTNRERLAIKPGLTDEKVDYPSQSENGFTLLSVVPAAQAKVLQKSLAEIGDVDSFLVEQLGYSGKEELYGYLAAEQIDSVALAIHQMNKGNAFIIGDMTGVGKGRQGAALIRYAVKQGKVPIYFTQKSTLFTDNYRDLTDIGCKNLRPFIIASDDTEHSPYIKDAKGNVIYKLPKPKERKRVFDYIMKNGKLPAEYDYVITVYSQIQNGNIDYEPTENGWVSKPKEYGKKEKVPAGDITGQERRDVIARLAEGNIVILDESHTVGGESGSGRYMQMVTSQAGGVTFMSATFAKKAANMPIYAQRTAISEAGIKPDELIGAIAKGGVTLQEIMSRQLVESGQMIRRERSFEGVNIDWLNVDDETNRKQRSQFNEVADIFNAIRSFQDEYIKPVIESMSEEVAERGATVGQRQGTKDLGVKNVPFASKMYNLVNQLLFALKVDAVSDRVIENLKNGYKPVISFTNTMEGFLEEAPKGVEMDEVPNFSVTLMRALKGVMRYTENDADKNSTGGEISLSALSPEGQKTYNEIRARIEALSADLPISPMDAIRAKIEDAGYSIAEITGRKLQLNKTADGKYIVEDRKDKDANKSMRDFNSGKLDVLMINKSGSTGISLHASSKFEDQRQRVMVFAQFQSDINDEVQMRGRIDRSGQVARGKYEYIMSTIPAEQRLQMMFKAKLKSLDANTTSSQKSKFNEMEIVDYLNKYGDEVVWEYMHEHPELEELLGDPLEILKGNKEEESDKPSRRKEDKSKKEDCAGKISRYLAFLSVEEQDEIFREITEAYKIKMQLLDDAGENDLEITTMPLRAETKNVKLWHKGSSPDSGNAFADNTYVEEVECDVLKKPMKRGEIEEAQRKLMGSLYTEKNGAADWQHFVKEKNDEIGAFFIAKTDEAVTKLAKQGDARIAKLREKAVRDGEKARSRGDNNLTDEQIASLAETMAAAAMENEKQKQQRRREEIAAVRNRIGALMQRLVPGVIYVVPQDLKNSTADMFTQSYGTFVGFKFNKSYTLGSSTAVFATLDGRRKVELALNDKAIDTIIQATEIARRYSQKEIGSITMENWDSKVPKQTRQKRYIITGNLLQALVDTEKGSGTKGNLISYSTIDGEIRQGILMGENFKPSDLRSSATLSSRLAQIKEGKTVVSEDGDVQISKILLGWEHKGDYELRVPKSKQRGGIYTMNDRLLSLVWRNNFVTKGGGMVAYVSPENIARVVDLLSREPFNLTVLEESKLEDTEGNTVEEKTEKYSAKQKWLFGDAKQNPVQLSMFDTREDDGGQTSEAERKANAAIEAFAEVYNRYADEEDDIITGDSENPNNSVEAELIQAQNDFKVALTDFYKQKGNSEEDAARMANDMLAQVRSEVEVSRIYLNNAKTRGLNKLEQEEIAKEEQQLQQKLQQQRTEKQPKPGKQKDTCETAGGEAISVESGGGLPKLKRGEFAVVERQFAIDKNFTFDGKAKIESVDDVAYIFRQLESYCVEHAFAMLIKDGKPTIVHLGMGTFSATQVNTGALRAAVDKFGADSIYFIHNHPSGALKPSFQDQNLFNKLEVMFKDKKISVDAIIIDTTSGKYVQFGNGITMEGDMPKNVDGAVEFPVHSFSKHVFNNIEVPQKSIHSSSDVAEVLSTLRLGKRNKLGFLLLNRQNQVVGNIFSNYDSYNNAKGIADVIIKYALHYGAGNVITYGNVGLDGIDKVKSEVSRLSDNSVQLLDGINVANGLSAVDTGAMESGVPYRKGGNEQFREVEDIEVINERFNEELQQQIDGTLPKGHIYQLGKPGELLKACGFPDMPIELSATNLAEHSRKSHHIFKIGDIKGLVKELQNPIAAFAYGDKSKSQNVIVEIQKDGKNFLVGVHFNQAKNGIEVSSIRGIFPKNNSEWLNWIAQGKSIYLNKGKIQTLIDQQQKILADVEYLDLDSVAKIVKEFENPIVEGVKKTKEARMAARVQEIADGLNTPVRIVQSEEEMAQLPTYRKRHAKGWFDTATGEVVIVVPNNENMADVENTVAHEVVAHKGLRKLVGDERFDSFLDDVYSNLDSKIKAVIDARVDEQIRNRAKAINEKKGGRISTMPDSEIEALEEREQIIRDTVEEYMAELAGRIGEHGFEKLDKEEKSLWAKIKERVMKFLDAIMKGFNIRGFNLTDKDLAYILYRSWKNLRDKGSLFDIADDITMRYKTGFNERREKFRDGNTPEDNNRRRPRVKKSPKEIADEKIRNIIDTRIATIKESLMGANNEAFNEKMDRIEALGGNIGDLIKAMSAQRRYDYFTVDTVVSLAQKMLESKALDNVSSYEVKRLLGVTRSIVGKTDTIKDIRKLLNIIIDNQLRNLDKMLNDFINTKGTKLSDKGVEVLGELDPETAIIVKTIKKYKDFPVEAYDADGELLPETILYVKNEIIDKMASDDKAIAENAALTYQGLVVARLYSDLINSSKDDERQIRKEMEDTREERKVLEFKKKTIKEAPILDDTALRDCEEKIKTCDDTISSYEDTLIIVKNERISSLVEVLKEVSDIVDGGYNKANEWRERDKERISDIHHNANSDLFGKPEYEHFTADKELTSKITNNFAVRFFLQPLATFDMMMRTFGGNNARGEGYLWNRFMRQWIDATGDEYDGYRECLKIIEDKLGEIFGRKMSYSDLIKYTAKQKPGYVRFYDAGDMRGYKIEHGGLLYMYMADKMFDGRMKLRKMGISENDMEIVSENLDPKLKEFADWVQEEFLVSRRNKYNDVHKRIFGAPMAAIENYFPLRILQNARVQKVDVAQEQNEGVMPTTITGGIIKRKCNGLPLDILNTNAVSVLLDHIQEMEHWAAFAEFNRDLNTLLSYKKFKNKVLNMNSIYGSGKTLWRNLRDVCAMVGGSYRPPVATADKFAVNIAKGVSTAKVSFRLFTALKQLTSMPAFVADANMLYLAKSIANPKNAWDWSMKELPLFRKRWESRMSGDPRLQKSDLDWNLWRSDFVLTTQRIGMSPNAFIDAITVAIGSYAIYKTKKRKYIRYGFPEEVAEKRAKQDAMILTNETQQSSESAFLSTIQVDRSWISVLFSVFRNASMSYTRKLFEAMRSLRNIANKNSNMIEFMQKQYERWGAENPDIAARNEFSSGIVSNLIMLAIFGYIMQFFWNSSSELPYLIFGDDEEEKKKALGRVAAQSLFGGIEGFTAGDVLSNAGTKLLDSDKVNWSDLSKDMPLTEDAMNMYRKLGNNNIAALNDIINIAVQSGIGVNPQTITDMVVAFIDASNGDLDLAREAEMCLLRVINCPQSQLDKIYIDELQISGDKAAKLTPKQFAERYAKYKVMRNAPLTGWLYTDEQRDNMIANKGKNILTQSKKSFNDLTTKEVKGLKPYLEEYERTKTYLSKLNKLKKEDEDAYYEKLDQYADTPAYWHHEVIKQYNSEINELTNIFLSTRDKAEMDSCVNAMILLKRELLQSLESMDK